MGVGVRSRVAVVVLVVAALAATSSAAAASPVPTHATTVGPTAPAGPDTGPTVAGTPTTASVPEANAVEEATEPPVDGPDTPPTGADPIGRVAEAVPGEYIVTLHDPAAPATPTDVDATADDLADDYDGEVLYTYGHTIDGFAVAMDEADARALSQDPLVASVEQNGVVRAFGTQTDAPWNLDRIDQRDLPLDHTYRSRATGAGVTAYVVDSGLRTSHDDLAGRATIGTDTVGDGHDGVDCNGHGTHTAGVLGGERWGVAKDVAIVGVRVLDCNAQGTNASVIAGIDWVTAHHESPAVANLSLGGSINAATDAAVQRSIDAGVTYVLAAGNSNQDGCQVSPARVADALTVGYTDSTDARGAQSNVGPCLDLFAPGVAIQSDWSTSDTATQLEDGSSAAAPHVAGVVAQYLEDRPDATPAEVDQAVLDAATTGRVTNPGSGSPNRLLYGSIVPEGAVLTLVTDQRPDDPVDVAYSVCPTGGGCTTTVLDDDRDPTRPRAANLAVPAGTPVTVTQGALAGWDLTGLTCDEGTTDAVNRQATVTVPAGGHATCRFTNEAASLTITVDAVPGAAQDIPVEVCGPDAGPCQTLVLDDDADPALPSSSALVAIAPGAYDLTVGAVDGWDVTSLTCTPTGGGDVVDLPARRAHVEVAPHEQVACALVVTKRATLAVVVDTVPDDPQDLGLTLCAAALDGGCQAGTTTTASLDDDGDPTLANQVTWSRPAGQYAVRLDPPAGWGLESLTCTTAESVDAGRRRVIVEVVPGEATTCRFTVRRGSVALALDTAPDGPQDVTFHACPVAGPCQDVVLDDDADPTHPSSTALEGLDPGVWTFTQDEVPGHGLAAVTCTRGRTDQAARRAVVVVVAGQRTDCTFLLRATTLTVVQDTQPDGPADFAFTRCTGGECTDLVLDDDLDPTRAARATAAGLTPGTYRITQAAPDGWGLATLTCDTGEVVDVATATATVDLAAGEQATCTFGDRSTALAVQLDTQPDDPHDVTLTACRTGGDCVDGVVDDDPTDAGRLSSVRWDGLDPGDWTVTVAGTPGWGVTGLSCTSGEPDIAAGTAVVDLVGGEQVGCTVTQRRTSLTLIQNTAPDGPQDFTFDVCPDDGSACTSVVLDDDTDPTRANAAVVPVPAAAAGATYTVTQRAVDDWIVGSITCDGGEVQPVARRAEVTLDPGEQRTCTFVATQTTLTVVNDTEPNSALDVRYTVCAGAGGAGGCHVTTLDDDGDSTLPRESTDRALAPGVYSIALEPVPGHALTRITCTQGLGSRAEGRATVTLHPGDHATCAFTIAPNRITVVQDTQPNGPQDFTYTGCLGDPGGSCAAFVLDDDVTSTGVPANVQGIGLASATYTVTQRPVTGYGLVSITCTGGGALVDLDAGSVTVALDPGVLVMCTFANRPTSLTIVHDTQPDSTADVGYQGCQGTGTAACGAPFLLDDDTDPALPATVTGTGLAPGTYTVTQTGPGGLTLTDLSCTAGRVSLASRRVTVTLDPGEQVTCTFVSAVPRVDAPATLVLVQDTAPDGPQDFTFTGCAGPAGAQGCGSFGLDDDADGTLPRTVSYPVSPGTEYAITQAAVPGFGLTAVTCTSGEVELAARRVTVEPRAGEQITCTWVVRATSLTIVQDTVADAAQDFGFTGCRAGTAPPACGRFALDDDTDPTLPRSMTASSLAPGTYSVTEDEVAGYGLTGVSCSATEQVSSLYRRVVVRLSPGDQVTCTFTTRATSLRITQDTAPNDGQDLTFERCTADAVVPDCTTVVLDDDTTATLPSSSTTAELAAATYTITQQAVRGYAVTGISCTKGEFDLEANRVTVRIDAGDQVTCTFTTSATALTLVEDSAPNDAQDVALTTCGPQPDACTTSILDDDSDATRSNKAVLGALDPGTYRVTVAAPDGWGVTGVSCTGGDTRPSGAATVELSPGEQVTCTFVISRTSLTLVQDTVPDAGQDVALSVCDAVDACTAVALDDDGDATLPSTRTLGPLPASTYTVTQTAVPGYALDTLVCTSGEADASRRRAVVVLTPGEQVTCTFTLRLTTLTVAVDAQPNDAQDFDLTRCGGGTCTALTLDDDGDATRPASATLSPAPAGTYTISGDTLPSGWALTAVTCTTTESVDVGARQVTVDLHPGEQTTCTFVVSRTTLTVAVDTVVDAPRDIALSLCPEAGACTSFNLDDDGDAVLAAARTFPAMAPGRYTVTQATTGTDVRLAIACTTGESVDLDARQVVVDLAAGEQTTCTFTNHLPSITIGLTTTVGFNHSATFRLCQAPGTCSQHTVSIPAFAGPSASLSLGGLTPGTYVLTQDPVAGFSLGSLTCTTVESVDAGNRRVTITLSAWEQVSCTFRDLPS